MTPEMIGGVLRAVLAAVGGYFVAQGIGDTSSWDLIGGAVVTIGTAGWSMWAKKA
jgi:hypothetical protein